jgi:AraC-like DNA-binding protein
MPAADVRAFLDALGRLGYNPQSLLASSGVRESELNDPDARVQCEALGMMLSLAQRERFTPNIGLELATVTPMGAYPLLDYLVATSETVGAGVEQLAHYMRLVGNPAEITAQKEKGGVRIRIADSAAPFNVEFSTSLMVLHLKSETGGRFTATSLGFKHTPDDRKQFERVLGCTVFAAASWNGLIVPTESWQLPLRRRDSLLRRLLETQADQILAQLPARTGVAAELQRALTRNLRVGNNSISTFARQFAMSGRTLQRRLAAEGVSYQQVVDAARKEAAARYLTDSTLAICEVAYLVGYSEPAPFHRAFKRWYGMTPEKFRRDLQPS